MSLALRFSLGANLALTATLVAFLLHNSVVPSPAARPTNPSKRHEEAVAVAPARAVPPATDSKITPAAITRLEQLGLKPQTIASVLVEDFNQRSTKKIAELQKKYAPGLVPDRVMLEFSRQSDVDRTNELKQALGEEGYQAWDKEQTLLELNRARSPGNELAMTPSEAEAAYRLQKEFDEKAKELQMAMEDGVADRADVGTLQAQAQQVLDQQLEKLLGKQRFDELRDNSDPSTTVYQTYGDLNPTVDQAKAVLAVQNNYRERQADLSQQLAANPSEIANITNQLKALDDAQDQSMRQIFGEQAYDNIKRQNDPTYKTLKQYAGVWNLNDSQLQTVYQNLHTFDDKADRARAAADLSQSAGQSINWGAINSSIEQSRREAEASLQNILGSELVHRMEQNGILNNH